MARAAGRPAILEVDDAAKPEEERRFSLPAGHAEALIDPESPYAMAAVCRSLAALGGVLPKLVDAYRTGEGVVVDGADAVEAQGDFNRPWLVGSLATEYLPQVPDVHEKLKAGARVADIACGVGWAAVSIARGYPATTVDGFDMDEPAIALARSNAQAAGVAGPGHLPGARCGRPVAVRAVRPGRDRGSPCMTCRGPWMCWPLCDGCSRRAGH
jgi:hypothetical protein